MNKTINDELRKNLRACYNLLFKVLMLIQKHMLEQFQSNSKNKFIDKKQKVVCFVLSYSFLQIITIIIMYEQAKSDQYFNKFGFLSQKVLAAKKRRKFLEQKVAHSQAELNYTKRKLDKQSLRLTIVSVLQSNKARAFSLKKKLQEDRYWSIHRQQEKLEQLRQNTSIMRQNRKMHSKEAQQWMREYKSTQAKQNKYKTNEMKTRTIEQQDRQRKSKLCFRQKQMLNEVYRIENIVSKDVQIRYLKSLDTHQKNRQSRLLRMQNLVRIKEDIEVSGLQPKVDKD